MYSCCMMAADQLILLEIEAKVKCKFGTKIRHQKKQRLV